MSSCRPMFLDRGTWSAADAERRLPYWNRATGPDAAWNGAA
jgi:hypothetical protein